MIRHAGESVCGEGWKKNQACGRVSQEDRLGVGCPNGRNITKVLFASYGQEVCANLTFVYPLERLESVQPIIKLVYSAR